MTLSSIGSHPKAGVKENKVQLHITFDKSQKESYDSNTKFSLYGILPEGVSSNGKIICKIHNGNTPTGLIIDTWAGKIPLNKKTDFVNQIYDKNHQWKASDFESWNKDAPGGMGNY